MSSPKPSPPEETPNPTASVSLSSPARTRLIQSLNTHQLLEIYISTGQILRPCHMFFYGSLMDPEVIQAILNLPELPTTRPATISGFQVKMWSIYPTLIPGDGKVSGVVWEVEEEDHFKRLQAYETAVYKWTWCEAVLEDDKTVLEKCRTFCWAGELDSKELEDGSFDLAWYQKVLKPSVVKRRSPES